MVWENFRLGLSVTGLGMALVFLSLLIVMLAIQLLNRLFKPKTEEEKQANAVPGVPLARTAEAARRYSGDEAAAIALAIALQRSKAESPLRSSLDDEEITGEIVIVTTFDPGPGIWSGYGRLKGVQ